MAVVNKKATAVAAGDAAPNFTAAPNNLLNARVKEAVGTAELANGDSIGSTIRLARIKSNWRVSAVLLSCDAITGAAGDIGLVDVAAVNDGAAVDADLFASAQALTAALANSDVTHESGVFDIAKAEQPVWQLLGLTADPGKWYDVAITLTAAATAAGTVALKVQYVDGN